MRRLGFPVVARARGALAARAVGGTVAAARHALAHGVAMNLAGGTHHAFPSITARASASSTTSPSRSACCRREGLRARAPRSIDLDVHQGNGTHAIFAGDRDVFTFSMHGGRNYPFHKVAGTLDIELPDGTGDDEYLVALETALPAVLHAAAPISSSISPAPIRTRATAWAGCGSPSTVSPGATRW